MTNSQESVPERARRIYEGGLQSALEGTHRNQFVAIEPDSGDYFLGATLSEAVRASRTAHPTKLTHVFRVGHEVAVHFGMQSR